MSGRYHWQRLEAYVGQLFERNGVPPNDAKVVAESLIQADLRGVDSHGVVRTDIYLRRLAAGMINTSGGMTASEDGPVVLLDGGNHLGAVVGTRALSLCVEATKRGGCAVVGVKNSNHFGTCAYYLLQGIREGLIMLILSNASQTMPPTGGIRPFLGTNPLSVGVPAGERPPFVLDMATSVVARGKIIAAAQKGRSIPDGWAVDKDGNPTNDAQAALEGSVLPLGGPKGYAISMFIDILCGVLTGAGFGRYVNNMYDNWQEAQNVGHFFIGFDIRKFMPLEEFNRRMELYISDLKSEPRAPGVEEILVPGEIEHRNTLDRKEKGIELPAGVERELAEWGRRCGLNLEDACLA